MQNSLRCLDDYRQILILGKQFAVVDMTSKISKGKKPRNVSNQDRVCQFNLNDLVRVDFVFPYGRVAATSAGIVPEPFDRDANYAANPDELSEMKDRIMDLLKNYRGLSAAS